MGKTVVKKSQIESVVSTTISGAPKRVEWVCNLGERLKQARKKRFIGMNLPISPRR